MWTKCIFPIIFLITQPFFTFSTALELYAKLEPKLLERTCFKRHCLPHIGLLSRRTALQSRNTPVRLNPNHCNIPGILHFHRRQRRTFLAVSGQPAPNSRPIVHPTGGIRKFAGLLARRFCRAAGLGSVVAAVATPLCVQPGHCRPFGCTIGTIPTPHQPAIVEDKSTAPERHQHHRFPAHSFGRISRAQRAHWWGRGSANSCRTTIESREEEESKSTGAATKKVQQQQQAVQQSGISSGSSNDMQEVNGEIQRQHSTGCQTTTPNSSPNSIAEYNQPSQISPNQRVQKRFLIEKVEEHGAAGTEAEEGAQAVRQQQQQSPPSLLLAVDEADGHFLEPEQPKLCALIYAEFDNDIGRVIRYQVPKEIFDKQRFDSISSAIIPSEEMRDRMIKINMFDHKIMGYPVGIQDKKYAREVLIFNMCFIVAKRTPSDWVYEPLVQKCAEYLVELERERRFLSEEKHRLPALMEKIFSGLNERGECVYTVTEQTTLYLKMCPTFRGHEPPPVNPFLVPIFTRLPPPNSSALNRMDVLSQKICPKIDGVRCIKDIACAVQIDSDLVARCIRNLCFYGCIRLLPMFLYSNCYIPTGKIRHFLEGKKIQKRCLDFVRLDPCSTQPLHTTDVCRLYLALKHGQTLHDWLLRIRPRELGVDDRKLIQFGVYHGFLRKMQVFPVAQQSDSEGATASKIVSLCTGERSLDELALHYGCCSPVELHRRLADNGNFRFIWR